MRDCEQEFVEISDEQLATIAKGGDRAARNALYLRNQEAILRMTRWAKRYLREATWAYSDPPLTHEDIEQQTFLVYCELLENWQPGEETFMRVVSRRMPGKLVHYVRDTLAPGKRVQRGSLYIVESEPSAGEEQYSAIETHDEWSPYAGALPDGLWQAVQMRYWRDMSSAQIARKVGRTERTVNRDIAEGLNRLRAALTEGREHAG